MHYYGRGFKYSLDARSVECDWERDHDLYEIIVDVTNRCYLNCKYCGTGSGKDGGSPGIDLPAKFIEDILQYARLSGAKVFLGGGCFFCHPQYKRILGYLRKTQRKTQNKNVVIDLPSCQETMKKVQECQFNGYNISLSLWGIEEVHDRLAMAGSYELVDQFKRMMKEKQRFAAFSFVMSRELIAQASEVVNFINSLESGDSVYFHRMMPTGKCRPVDLPGESEIRKFVYNVQTETKPELVHFHHTVYSNRCDAYRNRLFIDWHGDVYGCGWVGENKAIGNIKDISIEKIRNSTVYPIYRCPVRIGDDIY